MARRKAKPKPNFKNRTLWTGDNLDVMRGLNSETIDLIYLDPPFNSNRVYAAPIGSAPAGSAFQDTWTLSDVDLAWHGEIGYPTQKPLALLERIIRASTNEGDMVLDPFAGCATALIAAEKLQRQWAGIDLSPKARDLIEIRMGKDLGLFGLQTIYRDDVPMRTDQGRLPAYQTHKNTLYGIQEGLCGGCKVLFPIHNFTIDHKVPQSKGGTDHIDNLQLLCGACNSMKGTKTQEEFLAALRRAGIR